MNRPIGILIAMLALACACAARAQTTTENFEGLAAGATQFTSNGVTFDIVSNAAPVFDIYDSGSSLYGWNGSAKDAKFIDNTRSAADGGYWGVLPNFSVKKHGTSDPNFQVGSFWLFLSKFVNYGSLGSGGSVTVTGKLGGTTVFTTPAVSSGFTTSISTTNGFSKIDLAAAAWGNNANKTIDELQIVTTGNFEYVALDALTWTKVAGFTITTSVTPAGAGTLTCTPNPVSPGGTAACTATPGANYELNTISGCGGTTSTSSSFTTGAVNAACTVTAAFVPRLDANISLTSGVSCRGGNNGAASVAVVAGTGISPYGYSWAPSGGTNATATGLAANTYTVTVTDARSISVQRQATITQPAAVLALGTASIAGGVVGAPYSQAFTAGGGTPGYGYGYASGSVPGLSFSGANLSGTPTATGSYNIGVTVQDANGCTDTKNYPMQVRATVGGNATGLAAGSFLLLANGSDTVTVSASGPFAFPAPQAQGATYHVTVAAQPSSPPQQCTVTSGDGTIGSGNVSSVAVDCKRLYTVSAAVDPPSSGTLTCTSTQVASGSTTSCMASPASGYLLDRISGCGGTDSQTSPFTAGPVTGDCTVTAKFVPVLSAAMTQTVQPSCNGGSNGSLQVTPTGGFSPYTYAWSPNGLSGGTTQNVNGLPAGSYTVTVTDARDNQTTASATLTYPPALVFGSVTPPDGVNGAAYASTTFIASGGTPPLTFALSAFDGGALPDGLTLAPDGTLSGTPTVSGAFAFRVVARDANSCEQSRAQSTVHIRSTIGGTVSGLAAGASVTLANGADTITVNADGTFTFPTPVDSGSAYGVTVQNVSATPPQFCGVASGAGTVGTANVADVTVSCAAGLALGVNDDTDYASYGESLDYLVGVHNPTAIDASGVQVAATLSAAFNAATSSWQCLSNGSNGVVCNAGPVGGALADTATVPAGQSALWALHAQIDPAATAGTATVDVTATYASPWSDTNTLVIFRNGFDAAAAALEALSQARADAVVNGGAVATFTPAAASGRLIDDVLVLSSTGGTIRVQRLNAGAAPWLRLHWLDARGARVNAWQRASGTAPLGIGTAPGADGRVILLEGEGISTQLALPRE